MAKRTKKQQRQFEEGIKALLGLAGVGSYMITNSLITTGVIVAIVIGVILVITLLQAKREREKVRNSGIKDIDAMTGVQFERYLKELYLSQGYTVKETRTVGDFGGDLILSKGQHRIVVQAKRYSNNVGVKAVQEVVSAKNYYSATDVWVVTNSYFTKAARELAKVNNVILIDRDMLIDDILSLNPNIMKTNLAQPKRNV
jgi:restriction system protein